MNEENVRRLYPQLLKIVEGEEVADAGCALCVVLAVIAYKEGYSYRALKWLTEGSLKQGWRELRTTNPRRRKGRKT
jgi:hypothetical protein